MRLAQVCETEGGRVLAAFALLVLAGAWCALHLPKGEDIVTAAITLIARELMSGRQAETREQAH